MSDPTVAERVAAGAAALDEAVPGWWHDINLDTLNIESECRCILGQTFGSYSDDRTWELRYTGSGERLYAGSGWRNVAEERGFLCKPVDGPADCDGADSAKLEDEWRRVIEARRAS